MSNGREVNFKEFQKMPLPIFRVQSDGWIMDSNSEAKKLFINNNPNRLDSILSIESCTELYKIMTSSTHLDDKYELVLESKIRSSIVGQAVTWQAILYSETPGYFILIFMQSRQAVDALVKKNSQIEIEKTELENDYEEVKAMVSALRNLFQAFPQNTFQVDRFGRYTVIKDDLKLLFSSKNASTGNFWEDLDESISDELWHLVKKSQKKGGVVDEEFFLKRKNAEALWLKVSSLYGKFYTFVSYTDITSEKQRIEKMVQEERLSTIGVLAGGLAHQYNNLHHALLGLIHEAQNESGEKQRSALNSAASLLEKGATLSQGLLSHLRDSKKSIRTVPLVTLFERVKLLVKDEMIKLNCRLVVETTEHNVLCNPTSLDQVLVNLILNGAHACFATDRDRVIEVKTELIGDDKVKIYVKDNGSGIDKKHRKKLFTPLFSTKGVYASRDSKLSQIKGTGLGLSLAKQLMEEQGGRLELESTNSSGTSFCITLSKGKELELKKLDRVKDGQIIEPKRKFRVYVADDSPENRMIIKVYLKNYASEVLEKENGYVDIEELRAFKPEYIFIDWLMPKYSGDDFLKKVYETEDLRPYLKNTFIFTGLDSSNEIEKWNSHVKGVIRKPVSQRKLLKNLGVFND